MASTDLTATNFNILIAYLIPGFTASRGLPFVVNGVNQWSGSVPDPSIVGLLTNTVEALFVGLTVSTVRWLLIDTIHQKTGVRAPPRNFAVLESRSHAFELIVAHQYTYYKFYSNMVIALIWSFATVGYQQGWRSIGYGLLIALFFIGSRNTLKTYYERSGQLLKSQDQNPP